MNQIFLRANSVSAIALFIFATLFVKTPAARAAGFDATGELCVSMVRDNAPANYQGDSFYQRAFRKLSPSQAEIPEFQRRIARLVFLSKQEVQNGMIAEGFSEIAEQGSVIVASDLRTVLYGQQDSLFERNYPSFVSDYFGTDGRLIAHATSFSLKQNSKIQNLQARLLRVRFRFFSVLAIGSEPKPLVPLDLEIEDAERSTVEEARDRVSRAQGSDFDRANIRLPEKQRRIKFARFIATDPWFPAAYRNFLKDYLQFYEFLTLRGVEVPGRFYTYIGLLEELGANQPVSAE